MLSCWHDLLFLFCLLLFYLFLPSMGWWCGVGVFGLIECSHSLPAMRQFINNDNITSSDLLMYRSNRVDSSREYTYRLAL